MPEETLYDYGSAPASVRASVGSLVEEQFTVDESTNVESHFSAVNGFWKFTDVDGNLCRFSASGILVQNAAGDQAELTIAGLRITKLAGDETLLNTLQLLMTTAAGATGEMTPSKVEFIDDGVEAALSVTAGLALDDGGTGSVTVATVAGKAISLQSTDFCTDGVTLSAHVLRGTPE